MSTGLDNLPVVSGSEPRKVAAFVHADMVGYSRLVGQDDSWTYARLVRIRHSLIDPALDRYGGKVNNTSGDSLLMEFSSVISAVRFAVEVQTRMPEFDDDHPPDRRIRFRMGINVGDAIPDGANMHGDAVNIAARLQSACPIGGICVSTVVHDHVQDRLGLRFKPMGKLELKNIDRPINAFTARFDLQSKVDKWMPRRVPSWAALTSACALLICCAAGAGLWWRAHQASPGAPAPSPDLAVPALSIAVLPFINLSKDPEQEYLAEGISEDLTTDLSHLREAFVIARESAFTYLGRDVDVRDVGRQLGVRYVLEGSVRKLGEIVRINAQLVSANDGKHVWADRFDEPLRDLQAGQDETVRRIASALNVKFDSSQPAQANVATDPTAYDLILRARAILREPQTESRDIIAAGLFEQALRLDPSSVPAKAGVATMLVKTSVSWARASKLIDTAEMVAPNSPDVLAAKFRLLRWQRHYEEATATFRKLLDSDSSAAGIAAEFEYCRRCWGRPENAIDLLDRTAQLNPLSPDRSRIYVTLGRMLILLGRDSEAIEWLERGRRVQVQRSPSQPHEPGDCVGANANLLLAAAYAWTGQLDDAHATLASALSSQCTMDTTVRGQLNNIPSYYDTGQQQQERRIAEGLRRAGLRDHLDEQTDYRILPTSDLKDIKNGPTPASVPGATTVTTEALMNLLDGHPLIITTSVDNPTIPGSIRFDVPNTGTLHDEWQAVLERLADRAVNGDKQRPIVTFSHSINTWNARNLTVRLVALGYTNVYWYRGGWEAWDAHDLPKAPLDLQFSTQK